MTRVLSVVLLLLVAPFVTAVPPAVTRVAYSPRGDVIAFGTHDSVHVFDGSKHEARGVVRTTGRITALAFSAKGTWLAVASGEPSQNGVVQLFLVHEKGNVTIASEPTVSITAHKDLVYALAFAP